MKRRRASDMLMRELKEELEARDQPKTGNKAWLRRWLHGRDRARASLARRAIEWTIFYRFVTWVKLLPF